MERRPSRLPALRVAAAQYRFRESLFALPTLIVVAGAVLAEVTAYVDRKVGVGARLPLTVEMGSNAATWLLSTVAGAMITTAGVVFSLTVVSLQLASSQFSPRVMRSFIRDRVSQLVIGLLVATFIFCVLTLRHVSGDGDVQASSVSMTVAIVLTVVTVLFIIAYLNRLAHGLQVGEVVRTISAEAERVVAAMVRSVRQESALDDAEVPDPADGWPVVAYRDGWVTQGPSKYLLAAVPPSSVVRLDTRVGAYIHRGEVMLTVWPAPSDPRKVRARLLAAVQIADTRTMQQDVDFALRQLADIALRALSAAVNDPTTATEVVLRLGSLLRVLLTVDLPALAVAGPEGKILLRPWTLSREEYVAHAFDQIRQTCVTQPHVATALVRVLRMLAEHLRGTTKQDVLPALQSQIRDLLDAVEASPDLHPDDLRRIRAIAEDATDPAEHRPT